MSLKHKYLFPYLIYLIINVLFVDKYTMRVTEWHYAVDALYLVIGGGLIYGLGRWKVSERISQILLCCGAILYSIILIGIQYHIDPLTLRVDRWSAIHYFLDDLLQGVYPYAAQTHLGGYGSPFPVWQILHLPFYALGNVGLSYFFGLGLFLFLMARCYSPRVSFMAFILIAASPAINYEVVVRSDLITNFLCVCALCEWLRHHSVRLKDHPYLIAVLTGLCASTRLATVIPIGFLYGYAFLQMDWKKELAFVLLAGTTFVLTFLPFALWNGEMLFFFEYNPFVLQTRQGSPLVVLLFGAIAVGWTIYNKTCPSHFCLKAGCLLTLLVVITFAYNMIDSGNYDLFSSAYDISYLNMAMPFYICEIASLLSPLSVSGTRPVSLGE